MIAKTLIGPYRPPVPPRKSNGTLHGCPPPLKTKPRTIDSWSSFDFLQQIGRGATGEVWQVRDRISGQERALKVAREGLSSFLEEEGRLLARLAHPNIVSLFGQGRHQQTSFLVQEYIDGQTISALIGSGELDLPRALEIITQVCFGLNYLHRQGIVHCDIKPQNIMLDSDGTVRIIDLGLSQPAHERSLAGVGTMFYRAPEQANGEVIDGRTDIYSLGMVCVNLFGYLTVHERVSQPVFEQLEKITLRMTAIDPQERFSDALEIIRALRSITI